MVLSVTNMLLSERASFRVIIDCLVRPYDTAYVSELVVSGMTGDCPPLYPLKHRYPALAEKLTPCFTHR